MSSSASQVQSNYATKSLNLQWITIKGIRCLNFTFSRVLTSQSATRMVDEWKMLFGEEGSTKVNLIFDCKEMTDYEPFARIVFQKAISELKPQINGIWVISTSKVIVAGAAIMGLFASFPIRTVASQDLVDLKP